MRKRILKNTIIISALFVNSINFAFAAPSISSTSGTFAHGQSVTINGSGFGIKNTAAPIRWDNFEDGTSGALLSSTGFWSQYSDNGTGYLPQFSTSQNRHTRSSKTAKIIMDTELGSGQHDVAYRNVSDFATTRKIYFDYWVYYSLATTVPGTQHQIKTGRIGSGTTDAYVYPTLIDESWRYQAGTTNHYSECRNQSVTACTGTSTDYGVAYNNNAWNHVQWDVSVDTSSTSDGYYKVWLNGQPWAEQSGADMVIGSNTFSQVWLGTYLGNNEICEKYPETCTAEEMVPYPMSTTLYYDDVYVDSSLQRVEIGDASSYANCTHRETQVPIMWTDDSISFTANQGSFADSSNQYLYIIDSNGDANTNGYAITFGSGSSDTTAPTSQSGLSVV